MLDFSKSVIYKLCCNDPMIKDEYIGSTTNFNRRRGEHKNVCGNSNHKNSNLKLYQCIASNGGWANWSMIVIERYEATDRRHIHTRERYWMEELKPSLNCVVPTRTKKEYDLKRYIDNKEDFLQYQSEYRQRHKDAQRLYQIQYRESHKEKRKAYDKKRISQKFNCDCGGYYSLNSRSRHFKSKRCQNYHLKI